MTAPRCGPVAFLLTGLGWTLIMAASGMALYVGTVRSTPLPATLRLVHAHGALIGGVLQLLVGGLLAVRRSLGLGGTTTQWARYLALNLGTLGMAIGFWLHQYAIVGLAGIVAITPFFPLCGEVYRLAKDGLLGSGLTPWYSAFLLTAFVGGSLFGVVYSFRLMPHEWVIQSRLAHVHLTILGFLVVLSAGLLQQLAAAALQTAIWSPRLARLTGAGILLGVTGLMAGFAAAQVPVQLGAGAVVLLAALGLGYNLLRTWLASPIRRSGRADHLLLGALFLILATTVGLLVAANSWYEPRPFPFGSLHLVAYTHLMFVGVVMHLIHGGLSAWMPEVLAHERVSSHKKRHAYTTRLGAILNRWRALQLGTLSLGTMGLAAVAALTWHHPMSAAPVQRTMWASLSLLLASFALFAAKIGIAWGEAPDKQQEGA